MKGQSMAAVGLWVLGVCLGTVGLGLTAASKALHQGSIVEWLAVIAGFALVESRFVMVRIGRESWQHRFMEIPLCFALLLLSPWQLFAARVLGSGAVLSWRQRRKKDRIAFNLGYFAFETSAIAFTLQILDSGLSKHAVIIAFSLVELFCPILIAMAHRILGQAFVLTTFLRGALIAFSISLVSALFGLVLVAAWEGWPWAIPAILPFGVLFLKSWRGEIERSEKADALAALAELTTELTASAPSEESIAQFASRLSSLVKAKRVAVAVGNECFRWADEELAVVSVDELGLPAVTSMTTASAFAPRVTQALLRGGGVVVGTAAPFDAGIGRIGWLALGEPDAGTTFNTETDSVVGTVADRLGAWFANQALIDDLRHEVDEREYLAFHDPLTDLPNRRRFRDEFDKLLSTEDPSGALILVALDHFSMINDGAGHQQGDEALAQIAERLRQAAPANALVARLGGDEFAVLMSVRDWPLTLRQKNQAADEGLSIEQYHARAVAGSLLDTIADPPLLLAGMSFPITASAGVSTFPADELNPSELLREADQALQTAKSQRNACVLYSEERHRKDHEQVTLLGELRRGLIENELILHYQPKIDLQHGGTLTGVEALVRWMHPTRGMVFPDDFVPFAEHYDLLNDLFFYVIERAVLQLRNWSADGLGHLSMAVNLSARNLRAPNLSRRVSRVLDAYGVDPRRLTLELTETALMTDADHALRTLRALRAECGVEISVDDFGVGLSSIAYLRDLPASEVKIDKTFVITLPGDQTNDAIVRAISQLSSSLGKKVTAEGVENLSTFRFLADIGVDQAQGYWIARPMEASALPGWFTESRSRLAIPARRISLTS